MNIKLIHRGTHVLFLIVDDAHVTVLVDAKPAKASSVVLDKLEAAWVQPYQKKK